MYVLRAWVLHVLRLFVEIYVGFLQRVASTGTAVFSRAWQKKATELRTVAAEIDRSSK
jgi:hypothetical protein